MSWTKVIQKRAGFRWDVFPFGGGNFRAVETGVTSFYVSEFPDYFNAKRIFELFGCAGNVTEVAISPRRNIVGKRFAFARFRDVEDGRLLAVRLDNILIEGKKIHVNLPRFDRSKKGSIGRSSMSLLKRQRGLVNSNAGPGGFVKHQVGGKPGWQGSYAAALSKGQPSAGGSVSLNVLKFQTDKVVKQRFEKAFIGRVCLPGSAYNIQNYMEMEGVFAVKVTPLGSNCCLLEEMEVGFIDDLIKEGESWWKSLFSSIVKWEAGSLDGSRDVWYRIYGVPLHAWCPEFFMALGESWGRFVCMDGNTSKGEVMDVARILVNTPLLSSIPGEVTVNIDGVNHFLCVREDNFYSNRNVSDNKKDLSCNVDSSDSEDSSESEFERMLANSVSGDSVEMVESVVKEGTKTSSGGPIEKEFANQCNMFASLAEGISDDNIGDKLTVSHEVLSEGLNPRLVDSVKLPDSGKAQSDGILSSRFRTTSEFDHMNSSIHRNFSIPTVYGQKLPLDAVKDGRLGETPCSDTINSTGSKSSSAATTSPIAVSPGCDGTSKLISVSSAGNGARSGCSGSAPIVNEQQHSSPLANLGNAPVLHKGGRRLAVSAAPSSLCLQAGLCLERFDVPENCGSDTASFSNELGGFSIAGSSFRPGCTVHHGSDSIAAPLGSAVGEVALDGVSADAGCFDSATPLSCPNKAVQPGDIGGRKPIRKVSLVLGQHGVGKGKAREKLCDSGIVKGTCSLAQSSDSVSKCYGEQSEDSDIARNNGRQWEMLRREVGDRLREALNALGVVDRMDGHLHRIGSESVSGGRKEFSDMSQ